MVTSPAPVRGGSSYGMWHVTHGARHVIKEVAKKLLERGADPNALDVDGKAPLHYAAQVGLNTVGLGKRSRREGRGATRHTASPDRKERK